MLVISLVTLLPCYFVTLFILRYVTKASKLVVLCYFVTLSLCYLAHLQLCAVAGGDAEEHHVVGLHLAEITAGDVEHVAPRGEHFRAFPDRDGGSLQV